MAPPKRTIRKKGDHTSENMLKALRLHRNGVSIRKAAKECHIAYPTLRRYVSKNLSITAENLIDTRLTPNYENKKIFTQDQENALKDYFEECALKFYGLTAKECRKVAYQMAVINQIPMPEGWKRDQIAGKEWLRSFRTRHSGLSLKKPESCSLARATSFNRTTVTAFFDNLKRAMERHPSFGNGCRLYNLDETGTTTVQRSQKVIAPKGKHNIAKVTSGEKGTLVTTCAIVCARGEALPPVLVFPRKNFKDFMMTGAPPGSLGLAHKSGWMTSELFVEVMKHFIKFSSSSLDNPSLLILDNHESHLSIEALDLAKKSGVTVLTLPPHTTSKLQPLDVGLMGPFKVYYNAAIDSWMMRNPGKPLTIYNVAECVGTAYAKSMTPTNISSAFRKCGIFPFDSNIFTEIDFLPSDVTDRPEPTCDAPTLEISNANRPDSKTPSLYSDDDNETNKSKITNVKPSLDISIVQEPSNRLDSRTPSLYSNDSNDNDILRDAQSPSLLDTLQENTQQLLPYLSQHETIPSEVVTAPVSIVAIPSSPLAAPVVTQEFKSPKHFMPPLKAGPRANNRKIRKSGKTMIATDTPEKKEIENRKKEKERKIKVEQTKRAVLSDKNIDLKYSKTKGKNKPVLKEPARNKSKNKKSKKEVVESSSGEETDTIIELSESEISDLNESDDEDNMKWIRGNFEKLERKPIVGEYVLVSFVVKITIFYIAKIIEVARGNKFEVLFMRLINKENMKFKMPLEPDMAEVELKDIKVILPPPKVTGTKFRNSTYIFPVRVAPNIHLR